MSKPIISLIAAALAQPYDAAETVIQIKGGLALALKIAAAAHDLAPICEEIAPESVASTVRVRAEVVELPTYVPVSCDAVRFSC